MCINVNLGSVMTGSGMCHHKAISEGTGHSFTKRKGVLMKRHVLKYPLHQPPLRCYSWFDREGEAALLLLIPSVLRAGLGLLDNSSVCMARQALTPGSPLLWPHWLWAPAWVHCSPCSKATSHKRCLLLQCSLQTFFL